MKVPEPIHDVLATYDAKSELFPYHTLVADIFNSIDQATLSDAEKAGLWAEGSAFNFGTRGAPNGGPWKSFFHPLYSQQSKETGEYINLHPNIDDAPEGCIEYWLQRARETHHPLLRARYADLVWEFSRRLTGKGAPVEAAHIAIDGYLDVAKIHNRGKMHWLPEMLHRMMSLALSISDTDRISTCVNRIIQYADETEEVDKVGTYITEFDILLGNTRAPQVNEEQQQRVLDRLEANFAEITKPGGPHEVEPTSAQAIGDRLANYYRKCNRKDDLQRVYTTIADAFERRAKRGDPLSGLFFLEKARHYYALAGSKDEAERMLRESKELAPAATAGMAKQQFEFEIPTKEVEDYCDRLTAAGTEQGLGIWTSNWIANQDSVIKQKQELDNSFVSRMMGASIIDESGIVANVDDTRGDADGPLIRETAQWISMTSIWITWGLDRLIKEGLDHIKYADFISKCPALEADRIPIVRQGFASHLSGDYVQSVHILVPQIERILVNIVYLLGGSPMKQHRTGRGATQSKNMEDALVDERFLHVTGPSLSMHLRSVLTHPKGMNIRNAVCHGLWNEEDFSKNKSELVIHALAAASLLRPKETADSTKDVE